MFNLSKESKLTFFALLFIPFIWVTLNHFGTLDYLKIKSVDLRKQYRGEIPQNFEENALDRIQVEGNKTVPRIPKLIYVNFDAATLAMDGVGERPWDRAFFRDTALAILEKGEARAIGFDFGFTPKSMSKMVPRENSYRSDKAMGELIEKYPNRVVLGSLYSGVQTAFVKPINASAFAPLFSEGYVKSSSGFCYPESSTYPLISFNNGEYIGRMGSFDFLPYREVDNVKRWSSLWYPSGGKAHAYNILGGKQRVLDIEMPIQNADVLAQLNEQISRFLEVEVTPQALNIIKIQKEKLSLVLKSHQQDLEEIEKLESEIEANRNQIDQVPGAEIKKTIYKLNVKPRIERRDEICRKPLRLKLEESLTEVENTIQVITKKVYDFSVAEQDRLGSVNELLGLNLKKNDFTKKLEDLEKALSADRINEAKTNFSNKISELQRVLNSINKWEKYLGIAPTKLIETNSTLRLEYLNGELVESLPNEVPLTREGPIFTLAVETLLAYYGLNHEHVEISADKKKLIIFDLSGKALIEVPQVGGQWLEVNYFSKWTEQTLFDQLYRKAKKLYSDKDIPGYFKAVSQSLRNLLNQVETIEKLPDSNEELLQIIDDLLNDDDLLEIARRFLIYTTNSSREVPTPDELRLLMEGISDFFIPESLKSSINPMVGMNQIINYSENFEAINENILELKKRIQLLEGPEYLEKYDKLLDKEPNNLEYQEKIKKYKSAINQNNRLLASSQNELSLCTSFFKYFEDAIVLIGPEEATFQDLAPTPFDQSPVPKVSAHGNLIKTLTNQEYLHRLPIKIDYLATLGVCVLMALLAVYQGKRASLVQAAGILLLLGYVFLGFETFAQTHVVWPITAPACAGLSTSFIGLAAMVVIEQKAKGRLKGMFGSYVSSDLVEEMVASGKEPSLGGEETAITAFFSDVQAFSSFSELLTPTGLVDLMNEYLTEMTNILQEERGTLDKYIGDAIVAMYGAPIPMEDHAYQAVRTSILMQQRQIALREKWVPEVEKWGKCHGLVTQMQTRIGCNTGTATVGNMGALDRFNYTMMGDMVNLAARCESGAKAYGAYIMVTEETKLASEKTKDDIAFRYLDRIVVKGRSQPVAMYEPTGFLSELTQETQDCLDCFQQGIDKYLLQDWDGALGLFEKAKGMEPNKPGVTPGVKDNPSMILIDRCKVMRENPPAADWDGVYVMTTK
ncbi:CHASE2 domain-containing protein [Opitutales bacterium]|nr:CHASE2 domain-containing protein [Opitutales bacterium]